MGIECAGHYFDGKSWSEQCTRAKGDGICTIKRRDLVGVTEADIGLPLAHVGVLNANEAKQCEELTKLFKEYCEHIAAQTTGVCGR